MTRHTRFDEALALNRRVPVVDGHADSILAVLDGRRTLVERAETGRDPGRELPAGLRGRLRQLGGRLSS